LERLVATATLPQRAREPRGTLRGRSPVRQSCEQNDGWTFSTATHSRSLEHSLRSKDADIDLRV
ncbi:MAG: hypothetical protein AAF488_17230, partial [Planctomycetota bacterium]